MTFDDVAPSETLLTHRCTMCLNTDTNPLLPFCGQCGHVLTPYEVVLHD